MKVYNFSDCIRTFIEVGCTVTRTSAQLFCSLIALYWLAFPVFSASEGSWQDIQQKATIDSMQDNITPTEHSTDSESESETFLEVGVGLSFAHIPHYVGSDQAKSYALPFPFFRYQSKKVSLSREGLKRYLLKGEHWDLDLSFAGSIPLDSEDNKARQAMPDLDWVVLAGPAFNYRLVKSHNYQLTAQIPLRFGVATDFSRARSVGWDFSPQIKWQANYFEEQTEWNFGIAIGAEVAGKKYHDYYYAVSEQYVTSERRAYESDGGFGGHKITFNLNRREGDFWLGGFVRYRNIRTAEFADSPLVINKENFYVGLAFAWIMTSSTN